MNIKELIKEIKKHAIYHCGEKECYKEGCTQVVDLGLVLGLVKQLDEPEKVKVPQFVADWIENSKQEKRNLRNALNNGSEKMRLWLLDQENYDLFARVWLDGYEVEEEKRYLVKIKGNIKENMLVYGEVVERYFFTKSYTLINANYAHTRKELEEAGFGWVFDCPGIEIEEVE